MIASILLVSHHLVATVVSALSLGPSAIAYTLLSVSKVHIHLCTIIILFIASSIVRTRADSNLLLLLIVRGGFFVEALVGLRNSMRNPTAL